MEDTGKIESRSLNRFSMIHSRFAWKTALIIWLLLVITIVLFVVLTIPNIKQSGIDSMASMSDEIASSIIHANASALITEEYSFAIEHCFNLVRESKSLLFVALIKKNGFTIFNFKDRWKVDSLAGESLSGMTMPKGQIIPSKILNRDLFQSTHKFEYSGITWGWITIAISLDDYDRNIEDTVFRFVLLTIGLTILGFFFSIYIARKVTKPITQLKEAAQRISGGDLEVKADIDTGDELQSLAYSFNSMAESLKKSRSELETRVINRTIDLEKAYKSLLSEIQIRTKAEKSLNEYNLKLNAFQNIYRGLIEAKSPQDIVTSTVTKLYDTIIKFDRFSLILFDFHEKLAHLHSIDSAGGRLNYSEEYMPIVNFKMDFKPREKDYLYISDLSKLENRSETENKRFDMGFRSYINTPLKYQGNIIGEINLASRRVDGFTNDDIEVVLEVKNPLALTISQLSLQQSLKNQAEELESSLKEKEILLKETHHRVKNNLQIVSSLLYLQSSYLSDSETINVLSDSQNRVRTMALVHEKLYQSKDLSKIDFAEYVRNLSSYIFTSFSGVAGEYDIRYELEDIHLSIDTAVPLGLIINELLSNIVKYAFPKDSCTGNDKNICISLKQTEDQTVVMTISDNGVGFPDNFEINDSKTLGLLLVTNLIKQLNGKLTLNKKQDTEFRIEFKDNR